VSAQIDFGDAKHFDDSVFDYSFEYGTSASDPQHPEVPQAEVLDGEWQIIDNSTGENSSGF